MDYFIVIGELVYTWPTEGSHVISEDWTRLYHMGKRSQSMLLMDLLDFDSYYTSAIRVLLFYI